MTARLSLAVLALAIVTAAYQAPDSRSADIQARLEAVQQHTDTRNTLKNTVRIRARLCEGLSTGTGFLLNSTTVVTNRHVIEGGTGIVVTTWDGLDHTATARLHTTEADLALLTLDSAEGVPGAADATTATPHIGDSIVVLGHRDAGAASLRYGHILERLDGEALNQNTEIMRIGVQIGPGDSGAPVVETTTGKLAGIVFAYDDSTGDGLFIPISALRKVTAPFEDPAPCTDPKAEEG